MMTERPLVAIILVNYNGYKDTIDCVKSLQKITYPNYKIIVVNNGSSEKPTEGQESFLRENTEYLDGTENKGFSSGNNIGMKYADRFSPKYYLLLNNDTEVKEDFLDILVETAENNSDAGLVCGKIYQYYNPGHIWFAGGTMDPERGITTHYRYNEEDHDFSNRVEEIDFATGCLWLLPVETVKKVGYMDESFFLYCEDDEYCLRLKKHGLKLLYCNRAVIYHKVSQSTGSGSFMQQYYILRNKLYIIQKYAQKKGRAKWNLFVQCCKDILRGRKKLRPVLRAYMDYKKNKTGKASL